MEPIRQFLRRAKWRYADNFTPWCSYLLDRDRARGEAARVLEDLNRDGVAITSAQALLGDSPLYAELQRTADRLEQARAGEIAAARETAGSVADGKTFLFELIDEPILNPDDILVRFALQKPILQVVNGYFGFHTRLLYYNIWHSLATDAPPQRSQLWHRDPEDHYVVKVFVYLSEVDATAGPFTYAAGSHPKRGLRREPESFREPNRKNPRSTDEQMAAVAPPDRWFQALGSRGTMVFADTRGYHKGGLARGKDRLLYNCMFASRAARSARALARPSFAALPDRAQKFALCG